MATRRGSVPTNQLDLAVADGSVEDKGFLGRWARRKTDVLQGKPLHEPEFNTKPAPALVIGAVGPVPDAAQSATQLVTPAVAPEPPEKLLSLEDVKLLTKDSDFKPFMAQGVGPEVRNAAMKKLFADPHFNVMDGLDIYIDDYSKADPIPESMLRQMASAKFLKLFDDEEEKVEAEKPETSSLAADPALQNTNNHTDQSVAQSLESPEIASSRRDLPENFSQPELLPQAHNLKPSPDDHANIDLRLQPDPAAPAPDLGRGA